MNDSTNDFNTALLSDHDLLHGGVVDLVEENRASARKWARLVELHRRHQKKTPQPVTTGWGPMTAREWTALETSEVWATGDLHTRTQLNIALFLSEHLPQIWALCQTGALDRYRASTVADLIRQRLDDPEHWAKAGARVSGFLRKHLRRYAEFNIEMVTCTTTQLRNRLNYEIRKLVTADEEYAKSYADRTVHTFETEDGIAQLNITNSTDQVKLARHRLHLSAKALRNAGDPRTVNQLMADLARAIATREGATWYRLLTDSAGDPVALSTKSYLPTETIWRHVVAFQQTCTHPACDRPAVECELDHDEPWPAGETDTEHLGPLCRRHHKAKHARDNQPERLDLAWETAYAS